MRAVPGMRNHIGSALSCFPLLCPPFAACSSGHFELDACPIYLVPYLINDGERHPNMFGRADERTLTADLISLRVIGQGLLGFAGGCKYRIPRQHSLLRLAGCCTVLRSRWSQNGIKLFENLSSGVEIARLNALVSHSYCKIYLKRQGAPGTAATARLSSAGDR